MKHAHDERVLISAAAAFVFVFLTFTTGAATPGPLRRVSVRVPQTLVRTSVTKQLRHIVTIGSTIDPLNGDQNPYGLTIAKVTSGLIDAGDLVVCNFNDNLNIQGTGTTIEVLHPTPGSQPLSFKADDRLMGCAALALEPDDDDPWVAAWTANDNPVLDALGDFEKEPPQNVVRQPWGQVDADVSGPHTFGSFYETNAYDGSIVRFGEKPNSNNPQVPIYTSKIIATGFSVNHGVPGSILAPAGLTFDKSKDTMYIVDSNANRIVAFHKVSFIRPNGITVTGSSFGGPDASHAEVIYSGAPLAAPISAALLFNGNIVVGNTANNELVEIDPSAHAVVNMVNLDKSASGALFGIAATGSDAQSTQIFFNDDNQNAVDVLER